MVHIVKEIVIIILVTLLVVGVIAVLYIMETTASKNLVEGVQIEDSPFEYIEVDGMTCLYHHNVAWETAVLSCNWAEWKGRGS